MSPKTETVRQPSHRKAAAHNLPPSRPVPPEVSSDAPEQAPLRMVVADDHALFRQLLVTFLSSRSNFSIVAEADRLHGLIDLVSRTSCDLLLLDLHMERNALDDLAALSRRTAVIVVTASQEVGEALTALRLGARAIVFKHEAVSTLLAAIEATVKGDTWLPPELQSRMLETLQPRFAVPLTPSEREVVRHVALGLRNTEVSRKLFVSEFTVKTHLNHIFHKLGVRNRVELTRYALHCDLTAPDQGIGLTAPALPGRAAS
jgi:DNA-binding NarL/FixJ family response regulator